MAPLPTPVEGFYKGRCHSVTSEELSSFHGGPKGIYMAECWDVHTTRGRDSVSFAMTWEGEGAVGLSTPASSLFSFPIFLGGNFQPNRKNYSPS